MTVEIISILIGFGVLIFNAGIQWGVSITKQKNNEEKFKIIFEKIDQWEKDAIDFYKNEKN